MNLASIFLFPATVLGIGVTPEDNATINFKALMVSGAVWAGVAYLILSSPGRGRG